MPPVLAEVDGDLVGAGQKSVTVNRERQILTLVGSVRPVDIDAANQIGSAAVGDLTAWPVALLVFCSLNTVIAYGAFGEAMSHWDASRVSAVIALSPLLTLLFVYSVSILGLALMGLLMKGGIFGLTPVESTQWGGLPLTLLLSVFGLTAAYPLGVVLALGRRSKMPVVKTLCVAYIELIRGVPLISLLFMSSVVFPLFLPEGVNINALIRAQVAIILFTAAYIAEVVRGGLQAIPRGQYEAAESLGLNYYLTMRLIVLPQALKIVIPPSVSILISAFKDTSLVVIIALFDFLKTNMTVLNDPQWMGFSAEAYIFAALIYFLCCFFMSNYSRRLERELETGF